jgi:undecaprenyl-diphosphatase
LAATVLLKHAFSRARPELWPREVLASYALPSGHALTSIAVFGMLGVLLGRRRPGARATAAVAVTLLAAGIGLSRIYLGVHWPSDVVAGWLLGGALLAIGVLASPPPAP